MRPLRLGVSATVCTMRWLFFLCPAAAVGDPPPRGRCAQDLSDLAAPTGSWTRDLRGRAPTGRFRSGSLSSQRKLTLNPAAVGEVAAARGLATPTTCYDYREEVLMVTRESLSREQINVCGSYVLDRSELQT